MFLLEKRSRSLSHVLFTCPLRNDSLSVLLMFVLLPRFFSLSLIRRPHWIAEKEKEEATK